MSFDALIHHYGVVAVFLGAAIEGEAAVVTGGWLASRGDFNPIAAALAAAAGSCAADQILFLIARWSRFHKRVEKVRGHAKVDRALGWIERRPLLFCVGFRFVYGMRIAGPLALGLSEVPARTFVIANLLAASVWGVVFTTIGYRFGHRVEHMLGLLHGRTAIFVALAAAIVLLAGLGWWVWRRQRQSGDSPT